MAIWDEKIRTHLDADTGAYKESEVAVMETDLALPKAKRAKEDLETDNMDKEIEASYSGQYTYIVTTSTNRRFRGTLPNSLY